MVYLFENRTDSLLDAGKQFLSVRDLGNKILRCFQLHANGFNVPNTLIIPAGVLDTHLDKLGLRGDLARLIESHPKFIDPSELEFIQQKIKASELSPNLLEAINKFSGLLTNSVAVRSSSLAEDTSSRSSAGKYTTVLNCRTTEEIQKAILECWSSLWTNYSNKSRLDFSKFSSPRMGVMLMEMVDVKASGVIFTKNPITGSNETIIEAVWGLGEGLVSKGLTPDRFVFDSDHKISKVEIADKLFMYKFAKDKAGTILRKVAPIDRKKSVLSNEQALGLVLKAKEIEQLFERAQDIEWAMDKNGVVWILQSRDITTIPDTLPPFEPPGPGAWKIVDHIAQPGTKCFSEYYYQPMEDGWNEEALEIGTLNRVKIREVNGFMYYQMGMVQSESEFAEMSHKNDGYWEQKRYLDALDRWKRIIKPHNINLLNELQKVKRSGLSDQELVHHLFHCFAVAKQMVKNHHLFTYSSFIPVGDFIGKVCEWAKKEPVDILSTLVGSAPNRLFLDREFPESVKLFENLRKNTAAIYLLAKVENEPEKAHELLDQIMSLNEEIGKGLKSIIDRVGYRIINGYDIAARTYIERPDILLGAINSILHQRRTEKANKFQEKVDSIVNLIPEDKHADFEELLSDVRQMESLRDERGVYADLWAIGILRHAYLEAGRRLMEKGRISRPELAIDASIQEIKDLLEGRTIVSESELSLRNKYRSSFNVNHAPIALGADPAPPPADFSGWPPSIARTMAGLIKSVTLAVDHTRQEIESDDTLFGVTASKGVVEGTAWVVRSDAQINEVNQGEILIVYQTTAAYNVIFPGIAGIITQFGGILSHPAILAREYEIPCVVGCSGVMDKIQTGMRIRLDGNEGKIEILSNRDPVMQEIEGLKCEYSGPMQSRNRNRVFNHLEVVSNRLKIVKEVQKNEICIEILRKHFYDEIDTSEAVEKIVQCLPESFNQQVLEGFTHRYLIEFHPCDTCNLRCSGCTYFQDLPSRPNATSFPISTMEKICTFFKPKAVTIVGGGEPALYKSGENRLGDLICSLGSGEFGCQPAIGVMTNGTIKILGNPEWHHYVDWIRYSLDTSAAESYLMAKGKDFFDAVIENIMETLAKTKIPRVGVGFLYHPGTIAEAGALISYFEQRIGENCPDQRHRFSIQFRPWRNPVGRPAINEQILSQRNVYDASVDLLQRIKQQPSLKQFVRENTNIAVNLLCGGARESVDPFSHCYFGLAKTVVRANGDLYPCFRVAAEEDENFSFGNIISDSQLKIALKELFVHAHSVNEICTVEHEKCLLCVFNNMLEQGIRSGIKINEDVKGDYFF